VINPDLKLAQWAEYLIFLLSGFLFPIALPGWHAADVPALLRRAHPARDHERPRRPEISREVGMLLLFSAVYLAISATCSSAHSAD
jgi:hypothetical protein